MRITWEKIRKSLGIPDKSDMETAAEFTGKATPSIEPGPWGDIPAQDGSGERSGLPQAVLDSASYSDPAVQREGSGEAFDYQHAPDDGVSVAPTPITLGDTVTVTYSGPLLQNNPRSVHLHWGVGPGHWEHIQDVPMEKDGDSFKATLEVGEEGNFEFCFRDDSDNWDNNAGRNWSYIVHDGELNR